MLCQKTPSENADGSGGDASIFSWRRKEGGATGRGIIMYIQKAHVYDGFNEGDSG